MPLLVLVNVPLLAVLLRSFPNV